MYIFVRKNIRTTECRAYPGSADRFRAETGYSRAAAADVYFCVHNTIPPYRRSLGDGLCARFFPYPNAGGRPPPGCVRAAATAAAAGDATVVSAAYEIWSRTHVGKHLQRRSATPPTPATIVLFSRGVRSPPSPPPPHPSRAFCSFRTLKIVIVHK